MSVYYVRRFQKEGILIDLIMATIHFRLSKVQKEFNTIKMEEEIENLKVELNHAYAKISLLESNMSQMQEELKKLKIYIDQQTS